MIEKNTSQLHMDTSIIGYIGSELHKGISKIISINKGYVKEADRQTDTEIQVDRQKDG